MIEIKPIASSSRGNCYYLTDGQTPLLLEAGLEIKKIMKGVGFELSKVQGCLISHSHQDHAKGIKDLVKYGVNCYASFGTIHELGITSHNLHTVEKLKQFNIHEWAILPFETVHDVADPLGFLLQSGDEKVLFITDTAYCKYSFMGITHLMIECNYISDILYENIAKGVISTTQKNRLLFSHFSLENVIKFLKAIDLSRLKETWLLHLSDWNSDAKRMKEEVQRVTGKPVYVCEENYGT